MALHLSYARAVDATLVASPRPLPDRTSRTEASGCEGGQCGAWPSEGGFTRFLCDKASVAPSYADHMSDKASPDHLTPARLHPRRPFASSTRRRTGGVGSAASIVPTGTTRRTVRAPRIADFATHRLSEGVNACRILRGASQASKFRSTAAPTAGRCRGATIGSIATASVSLVIAPRSVPVRGIMAGLTLRARH